MQERAFMGEGWGSESLIWRLSNLESGAFAPVDPATGRSDPRAGVVTRRRALGIYFGLGFASSWIVGGLALLFLIFVVPGDARGSASFSPAHLAAVAILASPASPGLGADRGSTQAQPRTGERRPALIDAFTSRQMWWKLPRSAME
jgi:hypothetical protein